MNSFLATKDVRLSGGPSNREGYVEILANGIWGTVCKENWNDKSATVICRQLGFSGFIRSYARNTYTGSEFSWKTNFSCHGDEDNLKKCKANELRNEHCYYQDDISLKCRSGTRRLLEYRHLDCKQPSKLKKLTN